MKLINLSLIIFIQCIWANNLNFDKLGFSDKRGEIIYTSQDLLVRSIEITNSLTPEEIESLIYFKANPDHFFSLLTNLSLYPEYLSQYQKVVLVNQDDNSRTWDIYLEILNLTFNYRVKHIYESKYYFRWEYVKGDLKDTYGSWSIYKIDKGNNSFYVRYHQMVDLGFYSSQWILRQIGVYAIKDVISNMKKRLINKYSIKNKADGKN